MKKLFISIIILFFVPVLYVFYINTLGFEPTDYKSLVTSPDSLDSIHEEQHFFNIPFSKKLIVSNDNITCDFEFLDYLDNDEGVKYSYTLRRNERVLKKSFGDFIWDKGPLVNIKTLVDEEGILIRALPPSTIIDERGHLDINYQY